MKNIHVLPTDKPSRLIHNVLGYAITLIGFTKSDLELIQAEYQHIYITSDKKIKDRNCWVTNGVEIFKPSDLPEYSLEYANRYWEKIILTTDQDLIKDGVQAIDDEFLEWWIKNPSCDRIDFALINDIEPWYKIRFPKEEPKQNEMVGNKFYKSADKVISINKKYNMKYKTVLNISIEDKGNYKNIFKVKSKYYKLNNDEKETLLKELMFWARQEINNLHPEQE
jgi:hypothetical protein